MQPGFRRNAVHRPLPGKLRDNFLRASLAFLRRERVHLVQHQPARLVGKHRVVFFQLGAYLLEIAYRILRVAQRRTVQHVQQQTGARQMAQELVSQPRTFRRAFNQAGNVGHDETLQHADAHHAEIGVQRGKGIIGNLRTRGGNAANQG